MKPNEMGYSNQGFIQTNQYRRSQHSEFNESSRLAGHQQLYQNTQNLAQRENLNYSRLEEHNIHYHTDKLYDPLRNTLIHPETIKYHEK